MPPAWPHLSMTTYIARRLLLIIPVLLGVSFFVFLAIRLIPGDPAAILIGDDYSEAAVEELRSKWGLDKPLLVQYVLFIRQGLQGDLGTSIYSGQPVTRELAMRFTNTLKLALFAGILASVIGISSGILAGTRPFSVIDALTMAAAVAGVSIPVFWLGLMLMYVFAVMLQVLPAVGVGTFGHLVLPGVTLSAFTMATIARQTRSSVLEVMEQEYVTTARSKGVAERNVLLRHALKNAMIPVITVQGMLFGRLLGGSIVTEIVFSYPGLGKLLVDGLMARDYPVVQGAILLFALTSSVMNLLVDLVYALADPRITYR